MSTIALANDIKSRVTSNLLHYGFVSPVTDARIAILILSIAVAAIGSFCVTSGFTAVFATLLLSAGIFYLTIYKPYRGAHSQWVGEVLMHPVSARFIETLGKINIGRFSRNRYETKSGDLNFELMLRTYPGHIYCTVCSYLPNGGIATILEVDAKPGENAIFRIVKRADWLEDAEIDPLLLEIDRNLQEWMKTDVDMAAGLKANILQLGSAG